MCSLWCEIKWVNVEINWTFHSLGNKKSGPKRILKRGNSRSKRKYLRCFPLPQISSLALWFTLGAFFPGCEERANVLHYITTRVEQIMGEQMYLCIYLTYHKSSFLLEGVYTKNKIFHFFIFPACTEISSWKPF